MIVYSYLYNLFQWLPESMRFDMARGNYEKALHTLKRIADDNDKPLPLGRLVMANRTVKPSEHVSKVTVIT